MPKTIIIPVWNVSNFLYTQNRGADHFGPFTSVDAAKDFVRTQVSENVVLDWHPTLPGGQSLTAQLTGGRWRIIKGQMVLDDQGDADFDAAILRAAQAVLLRRFGALNCGNERMVLDAAAKRIEAAEPGSDH